MDRRLRHFGSHCARTDPEALSPIHRNSQHFSISRSASEQPRLLSSCGERTGCDNGKRWADDRRVSMRSTIRKQKQHHRVRQIIGLTLLVVFCAMAVPLPLHRPAESAAEKDCSEPFPCRNRPCGCQSADQCWKKCCCFTDTQKVAWAKANHVKVPGFVLKAAAIELAAASRSSREICSLKTTRGSDVNAKPVSSGCVNSKSRASEKTSCCKAGTSRRTCCTSKTKSSTSLARNLNPGSKLVTGFSAAECQGMSFLLTMLSSSIVSTNATIESTAGIRGEILATCSERLPVMSLQPPLPPPKIAA